MLITEAVDFLSGTVNGSNPVTWADLGCGSGVFTYALAAHLPGGSMIYAIDRASQHLASSAGKDNSIHFQRADFIADDLSLPPLQGILMANSLHYVEDKNGFIKKIKKYLEPGGMFIIIEYETKLANPWVPFPLPYKELLNLFSHAGYYTIRKLAERNSVYGPAKMYIATIKP